MPRSTIGLALLLGATVFQSTPLYGQGFVTINGRNHPELHWRVAETEHFVIAYPLRIEGIEIQAGAIAEETYKVLVQNLGIEFDSKIRIYLSDEDEYANGFAVPLGNGHTNIWVHVNDAAEMWTGREKWLRKVVAHELVHIFHYRAVKSGIRPFDAIFGQPLPRFWTEGLAQYLTEDWDAYRGERWLRTAVLDDRLSYKDGRSIWNGRLLYSVGNAQVRYFADQYGDSTLASLLAHRKRVLLGLAKVHDFGSAFKSVTGKSYTDFYEEWRRHVNVQYNLVAAQMDPPDSLGTALNVPGQYIYDIQYSPDTTSLAVLSVESVNRPVRMLHVTDVSTGSSRVVSDGLIKAPIAWSRDGTALAFSRQARGDKGALLNDIYVTDLKTSRTRRITHGRRASYPTFSPDGSRIAFVASDRGSGSIVTIGLDGQEEKRITDFAGDEQLAWLRWHPSEPVVAYSRFADNGDRVVETVHLGTGATNRLTDGANDDRGPVWSPSGNAVAFTSLRDGVPNVFTMSMDGGSLRRLTHVVTGATAHDWVPPDSTHREGRIVVTVGATKTEDRAFAIDASEFGSTPEVDIPSRYSSWMYRRPPAELPASVGLEGLDIVERYRYNSWRNITHVASLGFPYLGDGNDIGIGGFTAWTEPLGKHTLFLWGGLSLDQPKNESDVQLAYLNNQLRPRLQFEALHFSNSIRPYGNELLRERLSQGIITAIWPLDLVDDRYARTTFSTRVRFTRTRPLNADDFIDVELLPTPEAGRQYDLRLAMTYRSLRPFVGNVVHPLDGSGARIRIMAGTRELDDAGFARGEIGAFRIFPIIGRQRLFAYGRLQAQRGETLSQDFIGLSRYDELQILTTDQLEISFSELDRVRGYRRFAVGKMVLFGSLEYRIPLLPTLETTLLGLVSLGSTSASVFADGALVYPDLQISNPERRLGVGIEVKNALSIAHTIQFMHAAGIAQPASDLGTDRNYEFYYRIRTSLPF